MPRLDKETKERIKALSPKDLQDIVLRFASKEKTVYEYILMTYLDKESGEQELFEAAKADLDKIASKSYKGFSPELRMANMLGASIKRVNEFAKVSNNKVLEVELLLYILQIPFSLTTQMFGTCFTQYDTKVAMIVRRLINLVNKGMHEDYRIEYVDIINKYLSILHRTSNHINMVYDMPEKI